MRDMSRKLYRCELKESVPASEILNSSAESF